MCTPAKAEAPHQLSPATRAPPRDGMRAAARARKTPGRAHAPQSAHGYTGATAHLPAFAFYPTGGKRARASGTQGRLSCAAPLRPCLHSRGGGRRRVFACALPLPMQPRPPCWPRGGGGGIRFAVALQPCPACVAVALKCCGAFAIRLCRRRHSGRAIGAARRGWPVPPARCCGRTSHDSLRALPLARAPPPQVCAAAGGGRAAQEFWPPRCR